MTTLQPPIDDREMIDIIGHELVADASQPQRDEFQYAINENPEGVRRLANQIRSSQLVKKPVPVLLSKLRSGAHLAPSREAGAQISLLEKCQRAYAGKLAQLQQHNAGGPVEAVEYAIDFLAPGNTELEDELRRRVGLPTYVVGENTWAASKRRLLAAVPALEDDDIPGYGDTA